VRDAVRFYVGFHRGADGIDGCYLHDPVTLIGSLLRPELVTESVPLRLACDTSADAHVGGSLYRSTSSARPTVDVATEIDAPAMKAELLERLALAVAPASQSA
jgi:inosine-uridine nucleoside N-ribohydrolase